MAHLDRNAPAPTPPGREEVQQGMSLSESASSAGIPAISGETSYSDGLKKFVESTQSQCMDQKTSVPDAIETRE